MASRNALTSYGTIKSRFGKSMKRRNALTSYRAIKSRLKKHDKQNGTHTLCQET